MHQKHTHTHVCQTVKSFCNRKIEFESSRAWSKIQIYKNTRTQAHTQTHAGALITSRDDDEEKELEQCKSFVCLLQIEVVLSTSLPFFSHFIAISRRYFIFTHSIYSDATLIPLFFLSLSYTQLYWNSNKWLCTPRNISLNVWVSRFQIHSIVCVCDFGFFSFAFLFSVLLHVRTTTIFFTPI